MTSIKTNIEIQKMTKAGEVLNNLLKLLKENIVSGNTGIKLDKLAKDFIFKNNCESNFKDYYGYPNYICVSVNSDLVHGIPNNIAFKEGDLVSIDAGCIYEGYHADAAFSVIIGEANSPEHNKLLTTTHESLKKACEILKSGISVGSIGYVIQNYVENKGFFLPTNYAGHGIGEKMHEDPIIPNVGKLGAGDILKAGMTICIEPMVQIGTNKTYVKKDKWTVSSKNHKYTAHFEYTILITETGYKILAGDI